MPANVEIKAKIGDFESFIEKAKEVSGEEGSVLHQVDTFFLCNRGRLKLRCLNGSSSGQLIHYNRADKTGPKVSDYSLVKVEDACSLRKALTNAYGSRGEVVKKRMLFMAGQTRIHVDQVQDLGCFMELEVVLENGQTAEEGQVIAENLMCELGVESSDLIQDSANCPGWVTLNQDRVPLIFLKETCSDKAKMSSPGVKTVFGSMEIAKRANMEESKLMLDAFNQSGGIEIDTAFMYAGGKTEKYLGELKGKVSESFEYATKANPWDGKGLSPKSVRMQLETSLKNLKRDQVHIFYLHAPDHGTPLVETLEEVDKLYKEGKFKELGLSNYSAWLVAEVYNVCKQNNWIKPTVYQGMYSALTRMVEKELFPCLRYYGMRFYGYSPLGGGFLTGKHKKEDLSKNEPGRFFGKGHWVEQYRKRYWKQEYFDAVDAIRASLATAYGEGKVSVAEAAIRWLYHHSALKGEFGDGVIIGSSSSKQLEENLAHTKKGPLDNKVAEVITGIWSNTSHLCPDYAR